MTKITLELPDDVYNAVRLEAERSGTTPEGRLLRMIEATHQFRVRHPDFDGRAELERMHASGEIRPLSDYFPTIL